MKRVPVESLREIMVAALNRRGVAEAHVRMVVEALLETSLRGVDTHGVRLFPFYLRELDGGRAVAAPALELAESGGFGRLDAGDALGVVAGMVAAEHAARLARQHGVSFVSVANSNHFGAAATYSMALARQGLLGMSFSNSDALVAPFGGRRPLFGTNPLSLAAPAGDGEVFCIDMATSQVSYSRVRARRKEGEGPLRGWAVADDGVDAADRPEEPVAALQPLGGYKGEALAVLVEVLCALVADGPFDHELSHLYDEPFDEPRRISHAVLALDLSRQVPLQRFEERMSELWRAIRGAPARAGGVVQAPGDPELRCERERKTAGIPLGEEELAAFRAIQAEAGGTSTALD